MAATCVALGGAFSTHRSGDRMAMNRCPGLSPQESDVDKCLRWLRFRVIAQGFTVAVAVIAGWEMAQQRKAARRMEASDEGKAEAEKKRFEARMKEAEEAHRVETGGAS